LYDIVRNLTDYDLAVFIPYLMNQVLQKLKMLKIIV